LQKPLKDLRMMVAILRMSLGKCSYKKELGKRKSLGEIFEAIYEAAKRMSGTLYITASLHFYDL